MAKKILIVDDEPNIIKVVESRLKANGYDVITASDGAQGIEKARAEKPDLILLDISMPRMNGQEALQKLKQDAATSAIPVIMLTGRTDTEEVVKSVAHGHAADYILKPLIATDFLKKVSFALRGDKRKPEDISKQEMLDIVEKKIKNLLDDKRDTGA